MSKNSNLVLSIFPGIDILGKGFEEEGYCVVRGPDVLWGGDIRSFHPPAGVFEGVIGGPPCQAFSALRHLNRHQGHEPRFGDMTPEYERVVAEAAPNWFLHENVPDAPVPEVDGYVTKAILIRDKWVGGLQPRPRRFSFGTVEGAELDIEWVALMSPRYVTGVAGHSPLPSAKADGRRTPVKIGGSGMLKRSIVSDSRLVTNKKRADGGGGQLPHGSVRGTTWDAEHQRPRSVAYAIEDVCEAMGLARDFTDQMPFTMQGKRSVLGNGVPMAMARAVAKAVRKTVRDQ